MPSDHVSNTDYHAHLESRPALEYGFYVDYESLKLQKLKLQFRCSLYREALEKTLTWLVAHTDLPSDTKISHLAENMVWDRVNVSPPDHEETNT